MYLVMGKRAYCVSEQDRCKSVPHIYDVRVDQQSYESSFCILVFPDQTGWISFYAIWSVLLAEMKYSAISAMETKR